MRYATPWLVVLLSVLQLACTTVDEVKEAPARVASDGQSDIVAVLEEDGRFVDFLAALEQAELVQPLSQDGPFSVFVPLQNADGPPIDADDHIAAGTVLADDLRHIDGRLVMLSGFATPIENGGELLLGDGVRMVQADVPAVNGVIHLIERPFSNN